MNFQKKKKLIDPGSRIIFGPARAYTTSLYYMFQQHSEYFHSTKTKEFKDTTLLGTEEKFIKTTLDIYLEDYDQSKIYIDCSLGYHESSFRHNFSAKLNFSEIDVSIYNVRNFRESCLSFYLLLSLYINLIPEHAFNHVIKHYDIELYLLNMKLLSGYDGKLYFIQSSNFDINRILTFCGLGDLVNKCNFEMDKLNTSESTDQIYFDKKNGTFHNYYTSIKDFNKTKIAYIQKFNELYDKNKMVLEIKESNLKILTNPQKNYYKMIGDFNEMEYLKDE